MHIKIFDTYKNYWSRWQPGFIKKKKKSLLMLENSNYLMSCSWYWYIYVSKQKVYNNMGAWKQYNYSYCSKRKLNNKNNNKQIITIRK